MEHKMIMWVTLSVIMCYNAASSQAISGQGMLRFGYMDYDQKHGMMIAYRPYEGSEYYGTNIRRAIIVFGFGGSSIGARQSRDGKDLLRDGFGMQWSHSGRYYYYRSSYPSFASGNYFAVTIGLQDRFGRLIYEHVSIAIPTLYWEYNFNCEVEDRNPIHPQCAEEFDREELRQRNLCEESRYREISEPEICAALSGRPNSQARPAPAPERPAPAPTRPAPAPARPVTQRVPVRRPTTRRPTTTRPVTRSPTTRRRATPRPVTRPPTRQPATPAPRRSNSAYEEYLALLLQLQINEDIRKLSMFV